MNRICRDKSLGTIKSNLNYDEIMDMFEIIPNNFLGMLRVAIMNDEVSSSSNAYFIRDMIR